jgi:hypothetical protein
MQTIPFTHTHIHTHTNTYIAFTIYQYLSDRKTGLQSVSFGKIFFYSPIGLPVPELRYFYHSLFVIVLLYSITHKNADLIHVKQTGF